MPLYAKNAIPVLMLIASLWGVIGFLSPQYSVIQDLRAEKNQYTEALDNASQVRILRQNLLATYDSFSPEDTVRLKKLLPEKADGVALARDVTAVASIFGITIESFSFHELTGPVQSSVAAASVAGGASGGSAGPVPTTASVPAEALTNGTLEFTISFQARYADFTSFLRELEKSLQLLDVSALTITGKGGIKSAESAKSTPSSTVKETDIPEDVYSYSVTMRTYWLK